MNVFDIAQFDLEIDLEQDLYPESYLKKDNGYLEE